MFSGGIRHSELRCNPQEERGASGFWAGRAADFTCWISVLLSSQMVVWVGCGSAAEVFVSWLGLAGTSRLFEKESQAMAQSRDTSCVTRLDGMQVHHG